MRRDLVQALPLAADGAMVSTELVIRACERGRAHRRAGRRGTARGRPGGRPAPARASCCGAFRELRARARRAARRHAVGAPAGPAPEPRVGGRLTWRGRVVRRAWRGLGPEAAVLALGGARCAWRRSAASRPTRTTTRRCAAWARRGHAFLVGAFEPGRRVAIDKPPVDLWLQVASTRLFGFDAVALLLPAALRRRRARRRPDVAAAHALRPRAPRLAGGRRWPCCPSAVIVARSDTMDAVMAALAVAGAALVARAARGGRAGSAGRRRALLLGLAFEVKLVEALLPRRRGGAAVVVAGPRARRPRAGRAGLLGAAFVATALAWLVVVTRRPAAPAPVGARLLGRLALARRARLQRDRPARRPAAAGRPRRPTSRCARRPHPTRPSGARAPRARARRRAGAAADRRPGRCACSRRHAHLGTLDRLRGVAALAALAVALALRRWRGLDRAGRGGLLALGALARRRRRAVQRDAGPAPALPGLPGSRGGGVPGRGRRAGRRAARPRRAQVAGAAALVRRARPPPRHGAGRGAPTAPRPRGAPGRCRRPASRRCRTSCARTRPARPTRSPSARRPRRAADRARRAPGPDPLRRPGQRARLAARGWRAPWTPGACATRCSATPARAASGNERTGCLPVVAWARAHGVDVSAAAGQPHRGALYALSPRGRPRRQAAEELPGPPRRGERCRRRLGPRAAGPAVRLAVEAHVLDARPGAAAAPRDLGHPWRRSQPIRLPLAAVDAPPLRTASAPRCRRSRAASRRRARPGRRCRGSRARAAGDRAGTAAASGSRRRPRRRPPGARTARSRAARSCPRRSRRR